ncbi:MAG: hypothetical protein J1F14_03105 [Treponema sp.]|nr:hypothetical protein [Treponema sp.]
MKRLFMRGPLIIALASLSLTGCMSSRITLPEEPEEERVQSEEPPARITTIPVIEYEDPGIKYEFENMLLHHFIVMQDNTASGRFAAKLLDESSTAQLKVKFPAGTYECLVSEKAHDTDHSAFYVYVDGIPYRVYPSNPPLGSWELTTRAPVYFTIDEPRTILVTVQANSEKRLGNTQMMLDFIQFVRR